MANITLSIPDETKARMKQHPHMRWSSAIQKLDEFEDADRLAKKLDLRMEDFQEVSEKIRGSNRKSVRALLHESHR